MTSCKLWKQSHSTADLDFSHPLIDLCAPSAAKYADYKTSWPPEPIGHKSWKANRGSSQNQLSRPPPGLASQKQPSPSPWSGGGPRLAGRGWGSGSSTSGNPFIPFPHHVVFFTMLVPQFYSLMKSVIPEGQKGSKRPSELTGSNWIH